MTPSRRVEGRFYRVMSLVIAAAVFVGFAPSFYLRSFVANARPLTPLLYLHGIVFTAWVALLITQCALISSRRADIHRTMGYWGMALAGALIAIGAMTALALASRLEYAGAQEAAARASLALFDLPVFAGLVTAGTLLRNSAQTHKRLMLIASVVVTGAAVNRIHLPEALYGRWMHFVILDTLVVALVVWDLSTRRRIQMATLLGGLALLADQGLQTVLRDSTRWARLIDRLLT